MNSSDSGIKKITTEKKNNKKYTLHDAYVVHYTSIDLVVLHPAYGFVRVIGSSGNRIKLLTALETQWGGK